MSNFQEENFDSDVEKIQKGYSMLNDIESRLRDYLNKEEKSTFIPSR